MTLRPGRGLRARRGSALILVLLMTLAVAALAIAAIFMSSSAGLLSRFYDRDRQFSYAADAALARVVSRLQLDTAFSVTSTTPSVVLDVGGLTDASGDSIAGAAVRVWAARTADTTLSGPVTISLLAQVYDATGTRRARRLDLRHVAFSSYGYVTNQSTTNNSVPFASSSHQDVRIHSNADWYRIPSVEYRDSVTASGTVQQQGGPTFHRGVASGVTPIAWPEADAVLDSLEAEATVQGLDFEQTANYEMRVEFVWLDLDADTLPDRGEGFVRIYDFLHNDEDRLTVDPAFDEYYVWDEPIIQNQCGAFYQRGGTWQFFPVATHRATWASTLIDGAGVPAAPVPSSGSYRDYSYQAVRAILSQRTARCFPAGSPYLVNTERFTNGSGVVGVGSGYNWTFGARGSAQYGGQDSTFTLETRTCEIEDAGGNRGERCNNNGDTEALGTWRTLGAVAGQEALARLDTSGRGAVLHFDDEIWLSGVVAGHVTVGSRGQVHIVDDITYAGGPHTTADDCAALLGIVADNEVELMNNAILQHSRVGWGWQSNRNWDASLGGREGVTLHGAIFSLRDGFGPEDSGHQQGNDASQFLCEGDRYSMGCIRHSGSAAMDNPREFSDGNGEGGRYVLTRDACFERGYRPPMYPLMNRFHTLRAVDVRPALLIGVNAIPDYFASLQGTSDVP